MNQTALRCGTAWQAPLLLDSLHSFAHSLLLVTHGLFCQVLKMPQQGFAPTAADISAVAVQRNARHISLVPIYRRCLVSGLTLTAKMLAALPRAAMACSGSLLLQCNAMI